MLTSGLVPHAIFLDLNYLREKSVIDFLRTLRDNTSWENIKIIAYSSADKLSDETKRMFGKMGVKRFVIKTSNLPTLKEAFIASLGVK